MGQIWCKAFFTAMAGQVAIRCSWLVTPAAVHTSGMPVAAAGVQRFPGAEIPH